MTIIQLKLLSIQKQGFHVTLTSTVSSDSIDGFLPLVPEELTTSWSRWQSAYRLLPDVRKIATYRGITPKQVVNHSSTQEKDKIKTYLNEWLNCADAQWLPVRDELVAIASKVNHSGGDGGDSHDNHLLLDVKDPYLAHLPWQEWRLIESLYPQTEIALRVRSRDPIKPIPKLSKIRILVVVGQSDGLDIQSDLAVIQGLTSKGAEVIVLQQPSIHELCEALWQDPGYHIFIYTGHSSSQEDNSIGWIELNDRERLSIDEFKNSFKRAIDKGLQLAIFNSCDGLGLANQLAELNLPRIIVMREPVPDRVAVKFFQYFFESFAQNQSVFRSVNQARKRLESFEKQYSGAMWLPTICIRESALNQPITWQTLMGTSSINSIPMKFKVLAGVVVICLIGGMIGYLAKKPADDMGNPVNLPTPNPQPETIQTTQTTNKLKDVANVPAGNWYHGGSTTWAMIRGKVIPKIEQNFPLFNLTYKHPIGRPPGSDIGIMMLIEGELSFAESSRSLKDSEFQRASNRGLTLKQIPVGFDAIAVVVHPSLELEGLSLEQIQEIYTGKITNWSQVGGPDLAIAPYLPSLESGTDTWLEDKLFGNQDLAKKVIHIDTPTAAVNRVANDPGSIYMASSANLLNQCGVKPLPIARHNGRELIPPYQEPLIPLEDCPQKRNLPNYEAFRTDRYPLTRRLFVIIKQNGELDQEAGEAYADLLLTDEGQQLIQEAGFVPVRAIDLDM